MDRDPTDDTAPAVRALQEAAWRRLTPAAKCRMVAELTRATQQLALADIRQRHPTAGERELRLRLASRTLEPELMRRAFGWDPEVEGY